MMEQDRFTAANSIKRSGTRRSDAIVLGAKRGPASATSATPGARTCQWCYNPLHAERG